MATNNSLGLVKKIINELEQFGISTILGGGWAEELIGLSKKREHKDIDLYLLGDKFESVDKFIQSHHLEEIEQKHMHHKRAFLIDGVVVEIVLIQEDKYSKFSKFWNKIIIRWPEPLTVNSKSGIVCLGQKSLQYYRANHIKLFKKWTMSNFACCCNSKKRLSPLILHKKRVCLDPPDPK